MVKSRFIYEVEGRFSNIEEDAIRGWAEAWGESLQYREEPESKPMLLLARAEGLLRKELGPCRILDGLVLTNGRHVQLTSW